MTQPSLREITLDDTIRLDDTISLDDKYRLDSTVAYLSGIEALVRLPILQHQRDRERGLNTAGFISGYRGSPLGGLDQTLWKARPFLDRHNIKFLPAINEDLGATAVWGSQQVNIFEGAKYDGVFAMWYGKGPGLDRSMDAIKHANMFGTSRYGGVLAIAGDDHAARSSSLPHQSDHMFIAASMPVLNPANVQEVLDLGIYGWELSRYCGCWVGFKAVTDTMDSAISAQIDPHRIEIVIPTDFELPADGVHARWPDKPLDQELRLNKYKIYAAREFARVNRLNRIVIDSANPRLGIITTGKAYLDVMQALDDLGIDEREAGRIGLRIYKLGMSWPLEPVATHEFARGLEDILVVEEKRSIVEDQLTSQLYNWPVDERPRVVGEFDEQGRDLLPNTGELTPTIVARAIASRIRRLPSCHNELSSATIEKRLKFLDDKERNLELRGATLERTPHYCSGCPHNTSTRVPEGSHALGGIGCHYMATWMPDRSTFTFTQMGAEGVTWVGQSFFTDTPHVFQNLGDGTYFHSGILAIRQTVAAGVNITYKILYNDAVAMTGGQKLDGELSVSQLIYQLVGEGVKRIAVVSDYPNALREKLPRLDGVTLDHRRKLDTIQKSLREYPGTTVIIYVQTCAAEKRRRRKRGVLADPPKRVFINPDVCEGCGDCSRTSNCLSVLPLETELGRKRRIDQDACNKDFSCLEGFCPSFISVEGGDLRKPKPIAQAMTADALPQPALPALDRPWNIVVAGVGGTGVLTVSALIAMAAHIEGKGCATMNQTGLAQKFGAVVSHVRIAKTQADIIAVRIAAGDADLLLGCDLAVGASSDALVRANIERTSAVINEAEVPTANFVFDADAVFPSTALRAAIAAEVGSHKVRFVDATALAHGLVGDNIGANLLLLGHAWQLGLVPVSAEALYRAIELNGTAVEFNKRAFDWGRRAAIDPAAVMRLAGIPTNPWQPLQQLEEIVADRKRRLTEYQDAEYAQHFHDWVKHVHAAERALIAEPAAPRLSKAVARSLYKLMAYKDEYEVARLYSDGAFLKQLDRDMAGDYRLYFHLAPPLLPIGEKSGGRPRKYRVPGWLMQPLFAILARGKALRGTRFDVFAHSEDRKLERTLIAAYESTLERVLLGLAPHNYAIAVQIAELPLRTRGFGPVKAEAVAAMQQRERELFVEFERGPDLQIVRLVPRAA
jgi:indolepyruvate ferredoxin oxidoreductase